MVMKKAFLFLRFLRSLLINDLFDNFESGKRNYCFVKKSEKVLNTLSGICAKRKRITSGFQKVKQGCWNGPKRIVTRPVSIGS